MLNQLLQLPESRESHRRPPTLIARPGPAAVPETVASGAVSDWLCRMGKVAMANDWLTWLRMVNSAMGELLANISG